METCFQQTTMSEIRKKKKLTAQLRKLSNGDNHSVLIEHLDDEWCDSPVLICFDKKLKEPIGWIITTEWYRDPESHLSPVALFVKESWRRKKIGTHLLSRFANIIKAPFIIVGCFSK